MSTPFPFAPVGASPAFDREALHYRLNWDTKPIVGIWRGRVLAEVLAGARCGVRVVDIGSGSGADAAALTAAGCSVTAVEPSAGMRAVAAQRGVNALAGDLAALPALVLAPFDVALLNFGVLNCVPALEGLEARLREMLVLGGRVVLVWMSARCPVDTLACLVRGRRPRRRRPQAIVAGRAIPVFWWSVAEVTAALGSSFRVRRVEALGLLVPSPELGGRPGLRSAIDPWLSRLPLLREWGDHTLLVAERVA